MRSGDTINQNFTIDIVIRERSRHRRGFSCNGRGIVMLKFDDVFTHQRLIEAAKRVLKKKGVAGEDGMNVEEGYKFFKKKYKRDVILKKLKKGSYIIHKSRKAPIPKSNGKMRILSIQTVIDRIILDCFAEALSKKYEKTFSDCAYAFISQRGTHDALRAFEKYYDDGYVYALKVDLDKYFDRVDHILLYSKLRQQIDKPLYNLITLFQQNRKNMGLQQGNPTSPYLSNLFLDYFDKDMEKLENTKYIRYADDILFLSKEPFDKKFLQDIQFKLSKIKLAINTEKTVMGRAEGVEFLGMTKTKHGFIVSDDRLVEFNNKLSYLEEISNYDEAVNKINDYIIGWMAYYHLADIGGFIDAIDKYLIEEYPSIRDYNKILQGFQSKKNKR